VSRSDRILVATGGGAAILAVAAAIVLLAPPAGDASTEGDAALLLGTPAPIAAADASTPTSGPIFVDVEGAVAQPGIRQLSAGSRVADAIAAAGGYASDVDLEAAATGINLAQPLTDGQQVHVPRLGDAEVAAPAGSQGSADGGGGASGGGLVDLNTATPEELEALPGIGPVTVQKIVAARQERPFSSLDDAVQRGVIHRGQLEDIRGVATAG